MRTPGLRTEPSLDDRCIGIVERGELRDASRDRARPRRIATALAVVALAASCGGRAEPASTVVRATPSTDRPPATFDPSDHIASPSIGPPATSPATTTPTAGPSTSGIAVNPADLHGTIAFSYDTGLWLADADGSDRRQLTTDGGFDPTLSPDGRRVVYRLLLEHDDGEIWTIDADGRGRRDLVNDPAFSDWGPAWSPDGSRIAFDSNRRVGLALWLMHADGSHQTILTRGHGEYPSWAPDGTRLAYAGGSYYDIRVVNADGTDDHALALTPAYDMGPAWSPDGQWIAYHTQADWYPALEEPGQGPEMEIHLVHPDGSADHRITDDHVEDGFPAWSPDGRFLMWSRHGELVVARPDGSGLVEIGPGTFPSWVR